MTGADEIIEFWFGNSSDNLIVADNKRSIWFGKDRDVDLEIKKRFEKSINDLADGKLEKWESKPHSILALVLLADQFPRNIYRDSPKAYALDDKALRFSNAAIEDGFDKKLILIERVFLYLPFEHSESRANQGKSVKLFSELCNEAAHKEKKLFENFLDYAVRHKEVVHRFGRFPHRNKILGRKSSSEEKVFLKKRGSSF